MKQKIILDLCGGTGSWSKPYKESGYKVYNITYPEFDVRKHFVFKKELGFAKETGQTLMIPFKNIYGILSAPPCTQFSVARTHAKRQRNLKEGMEIVIACLDIIWNCQYNIINDTRRIPPLKFWALENPCGMLNWFLGYPVLTFHPYEFGDGYSKKTCLWGYFNIPNKKIGKRKYNKKFDMLLMKELKDIRSISDIIYKDAKNRKMLRAITPKGFADAFFKANQ